jgi:hypothetical protein
MRSREHAAHDDLLPLGDDVLELHVDVGERLAPHVDDRLALSAPIMRA